MPLLLFCNCDFYVIDPQCALAFLHAKNQFQRFGVSGNSGGRGEFSPVKRSGFFGLIFPCLPGGRLELEHQLGAEVIFFSFGDVFAFHHGFKLDLFAAEFIDVERQGNHCAFG